MSELSLSNIFDMCAEYREILQFVLINFDVVDAKQGEYIEFNST